eukprot:CAMPEP_0177590434 /NCGR_PEP_ID=MMETSP0419_2-20121207/7402_1 /TAXON_ID=582737 /ORGANISM="Tetraselmis sp., Strain GSL018" /LENGTH=280 /DNA_ID=CAMNT_0019080989 /DNA_START=459 /DNA_END=1301 /DNA_ORIENTATION=+
MSFQDMNRELGGPGAPYSSRVARSAGTSQGNGEYQKAVSQVFQMSTGLTSLRRIVDMLGTPRDNLELRQRGYELKDKITSHAKSVTESLKHLQAPVAESDKQQQLAVAKLVSDFNGVLKEFQRVQRLLAERATRFKPSSMPSPGVSQPAQEQRTEPGLQQQEEQELLLREQQKQELVQLDNMIEYNQALIEERDEGIAEIQQQIGEVNEIFQDLAVLVNDQGAQLLDIESNVLAAAENTGQAREELSRAQRSQKRSRRCWCWMVLVILLVFAMLIFILSL